MTYVIESFVGVRLPGITEQISAGNSDALVKPKDGCQHKLCLRGVECSIDYDVFAGFQDTSRVSITNLSLK
jgi:hypothetical protein